MGTDPVWVPILLPAETIAGGVATESAAIVRAVLDGEQGPRHDVVLLNAAAALLVAADVVENLVPGVAGVARAAEVIDSGAAWEKLDLVVERTNR